MSRVSIIIPCHNTAPWVAATIRSALGQTWTNREIIVVDDGSVDDTLAITRQFESAGVRVVAQPNRGASAARNHGLRAAQGDFIQFLDADDLLAPDKIERQLTALAAAPTGRLAAGPWGRFQNDPATAVFSPEENWRDSEPVEWLALNFAGRGMMPPAAWLTPAAVIAAAGPWDERLTLNDDGEYFCRVLLASSGVIFCPEAHTFYRSNLSGSLSQRRTPAAWTSAVLSQQLSADHLLAHERSPRTRQACADLFQRLAYTIYPDCPDLVAQAETLARSHGSSTQRALGGRTFLLLARVFGWKLARRMQQLGRNS